MATAAPSLLAGGKERHGRLDPACVRFPPSSQVRRDRLPLMRWGLTRGPRKAPSPRVSPSQPPVRPWGCCAMVTSLSHTPGHLRAKKSLGRAGLRAGGTKRIPQHPCCWGIHLSLRNRHKYKLFDNLYNQETEGSPQSLTVRLCVGRAQVI